MITPILPTTSINKRPQRAFMIIHHDDHTVVDLKTNKYYPLPAQEAWALYGKLDILA